MENTFEHKLIEMIQSRSFLVNTKDKCYRDQKMKDNAWQEIARECNIPIEECMRRWKTLRDTFVRIHKGVSHPRSGGSASSVATDWPYYNNMLWYTEFQTKRRKTVSNVNFSDENSEVLGVVSQREDLMNMSFNIEEIGDSEVIIVNLGSSSPNADDTQHSVAPDQNSNPATSAPPDTANQSQTENAINASNAMDTSGAPHRIAAKKRCNPEPDRVSKLKIKKGDDRQVLVKQVSNIGNALSSFMKARIPRQDAAPSAKARKIEKLVGLISVELEDISEAQLSLCGMRIMTLIQEFKVE